MLINLMEILSGREIGRYSKTPKMIVHRLENLGKALKFIAQEGITLVNIGANDLEDCNLRLTLGLVWTLILRYQIQKGGKKGHLSAGSSGTKNDLLEWVNGQLKPYDLVTKNFDKSYQNPRVLCSLVDSLKPGVFEGLGDVSDDTAVEDVDKAMHVALDKFEIPVMMDAEDMVNAPDDLSVMTYISYFKDAAAKLNEMWKIKTDKECEFAFTVRARDENGELLEDGGDDFEVEVEGSDGSVPVKIKDNGDGSYTAKYRLKTGDIYTVTCSLNGGTLPNTPFTHDLNDSSES